MAISETLQFDSARTLSKLYGGDPRHLMELERMFEIQATSRDGWIRLEGDECGVRASQQVFSELENARQRGVEIRRHEFYYTLGAVKSGMGGELARLWDRRIQLSKGKGIITPKTFTQKGYLEMIEEKDLVFGLGPAGTGKTYLAMASALHYLKEGKVKRIVLTRPAVEAGEALGFLPGDLKEKLFPYLRPLYDALYDLIDPLDAEGYMEKGVIEVAPLAYMRGRTISDAFIILDEGQNATRAQMFMLLTRLGQGAKCVVTGDPSQVDLPKNRRSGLEEAVAALGRLEGIGITRFHESEVVRHELVSQIISAYRELRGTKGEGFAL